MRKAIGWSFVSNGADVSVGGGLILNWVAPGVAGMGDLFITDF